MGHFGFAVAIRQERPGAQRTFPQFSQSRASADGILPRLAPRGVNIVELKVGQGLRYAAGTLQEALRRPTVTSIVLAPGVHRAETVRLTRSVVMRGEPGAVLAANIHVVSGHATFVDLRWTGRLVLGPGTAAALRRTTLTAASGAGLWLEPDARAELEEVEVVGASGAPSAIWVGHGAHLAARRCLLSAPHGPVLQLTDQAHADVSESGFLVDAGSGPAVRAADEGAPALPTGHVAGSAPPPKDPPSSPLLSTGGRARLTARACTFAGARWGLSARGASQVTLVECSATARARVLPGDAWIDVGDHAVVAVAGGRFEVEAGAAAVQGAGRLTLQHVTVVGRGGVGLSTQDSAVLDASHLHMDGFDNPMVGRGGQLHVGDAHVTGGNPAVRLVSGSGTRALLERCLIADSGGAGVQVEDTTACTLADSTVRRSHGAGVAILAGAEAAVVACVLEDNVGPAVDAAPGSRGLVSRSVVRGAAAERALAIHRGSWVLLQANRILGPTLPGTDASGAGAARDGRAAATSPPGPHLRE